MDSLKLTALGHIPKFEGDPVNYQSWRNAVEDVARINDVSELLTPNPESHTKFTEPQWKRVDSQFVGVMLVSLSPEVRKGIENTAALSVFGLLCIMDKTYNSISMSHKYKLLHELLEFKQNGKSVAMVTNEFRVLASRIRAAKINIEDLLILIYINGFEADYEVLKMVLQASPQTPEFDDVVARMTTRELEINRGSSNMNVALQIEGDRRKSTMSQVRFSKSCTNCKRIGHTVENCWGNGGGAFHRRPPWLNSKRGTAAVSQPAEHSVLLHTDPTQTPSSSCLQNLEFTESEFFMAHSHHVPDYSRNSWIIDSGCSTSATHDKRLFEKYRPMRGNISIGDGSQLDIHGIGSITIQSYVNGKVIPLQINEVHHIPRLQRNLISYGQLIRMGYTSNDYSERGSWKFFDSEGNQILHARQQPNNLYKIEVIKSMPIVCLSESEKLHGRLGHFGRIKGQACDICNLTKAFQYSPSRTISDLPREIHDLVVTDVWGPYQTPSKSGSRYFVSFIDAKSRYSHIFFLKNKSEVFEKVKLLNNRIINETGRGIRYLRSDNGGEFKNKALDEYAKAVGLTQQYTIPGTPSQNGIAERFNRTVIQIARSLKLLSGLPDILWPEIVQHANTIRNFCPTSATGKSPYEEYYGSAPPIEKLYLFGSIVIVHRDKIERCNKLDYNGTLGVYLGFAVKSKGFRVWLPKEDKIIELSKIRISEERVYKDVTWAERLPTQFNVFSEPSEVIEFLKIQNDHNLAIPEVPLINDQPHTERIDDAEQQLEESGSESTPVDDSELYEYKPTPAGTPFVPIVRPRIGAVARQKDIQRKKEKNQVNYLSEGIVNHGELGLTKEVVNVPQCFTEAVKDTRWASAMEVEAASFKAHGVFQIVDRTPEMRLIPGKWIYTEKTLVNGSTVPKARFVAVGYRQREGIEYQWTYSPTTLTISLRIMLTMIASMDLLCDHLDVTTAFLHGPLHEDIYMEIPPGFGIDANPGQVVRLTKAIYGLRQAGREWNSMIDAEFKKLGLKPLVNDRTIYILQSGMERLYLVLYVDDILLASSSRSLIDEVKANIGKTVNIKDLGAVQTFLGISITRNKNNHVIQLSQRKYIESITTKYDILNYRTIPEIEAGSDLLTPASKRTYQGLVGAIMWVTNNTRPDLAARIGIQAQAVASPSMADWMQLVKIARDLFKTRDEILTLGGLAKMIPEAYVDASWGGSQSDGVSQKSRQGCLILLGKSSICWWSRVQRVVAQSSAEAEYLALSEAVKDIAYVKSTIEELGITVEFPIVVYEDNTACVQMVNEGAITRKTRHIAIRERLAIMAANEEKLIEVRKVKSAENLADVMTKCLPYVKVEAIKTRIGVLKLPGVC